MAPPSVDSIANNDSVYVSEVALHQRSASNVPIVRAAAAAAVEEDVAIGETVVVERSSDGLADELSSDASADDESSPQQNWELPQKQGLYDPENEHDACGVGFIVAIDGKRSHKIIRDAQVLSSRMVHRGACACDNDTGDGAGVMCAIPHDYFTAELLKTGQQLPDFGRYATGILFLDRHTHQQAETEFNALAIEIGLTVLCWRTVPTNSDAVGHVAKKTEPFCRQVFVAGPTDLTEEELVRRVFVLRKRATHTLSKSGRRFYVCSLSIRTIVYKGLFTSDQLWNYFVDLLNPDFDTYLALVHTRFSTNTFPSWERAHPLRVIAHNGEINTLRGNVNLMKAREGVMRSAAFGDDLKRLFPVVEPNLSDSGSADCVLEFLNMVGQRTLPEAVMTMVPEAWQNDRTMQQEKRDYYQWAACVMEPWDGPALISFTDGRYIGAVLDRNGLRPSRFYVTTDNVLVMASEVGVYDVPAEKVVLKSRLKPGRMLLVDTQEKKLIQDVELKASIAKQRPHSEWLQQKITMADLRTFHQAAIDAQPLLRVCSPRVGPTDMFDPRLLMFGYTTETILMLIKPMIATGKEALGSMGNDAPLACLSAFQPLTYDYFKQLFAQVTNPPIDPFREKIVMSLECPLGPEGNLLQPSAEQVHRIWLRSPILSVPDATVLKLGGYRGWQVTLVDMTFAISDGMTGYMAAIERICAQGEEGARAGHQIIVLSDRSASADRCPVSALIGLGALHQHLIETRLRSKVGLVVETGEAREVHHMCLLLGYGADAVCPYLTIELAMTLRDQNVVPSTLTEDQVHGAYAQALETGICKVMAKMGISTLQSYKCAQIFEAVGLGQDVIDRCFRGTQSRIGGVSLEVLARESMERHSMAYENNSRDTKIVRNPGTFHWRNGGEAHINEPTSVASLQEAAVNKNQNAFEDYKRTTMKSVKDCCLRGQMELVKGRPKVDISEVESAADIIKRFATGAMSFGSISLEAHETLAITMNRLGGKSNTGEGGENADRYLGQDPANNKRSAIKQIASGRFGVTAMYIANADDLQIKMAQGAKPGEGGELPGYKVTADIAAVRHSVPGVGLISPPPHHDIYSIEDLAELIYDLKCANPRARISVKLVSEVGVGVVAAGVAKGKAEHIVVSGHDGGTGASSWTGIKSAGLPWELGVAEAHQVLVLNNLRSRVIVQADGQLRTGFDVVVAAILGADEFGFSTAPLIVMGCTMMRKCHLNTCPVGIATQDPVLRAKFTGKPEHVINFFFMLAEDIRSIMAELGIRKFQQLIGRTDLLQMRTDASLKAATLDMSHLLKNALDMRPDTNIIGGSERQDFGLEGRADNALIEKCRGVLEGREKAVVIDSTICNEERAYTSTLSYEIVKAFGQDSLPAGRTIDINLTGSAGQSFGAFMVGGITMRLQGDANDYVGKSMCGGTIIITPPPTSTFESHLNVIVGNVCLYGATAGKALFRGIAAERFCVRNSGVTAVVEGVGDHGCEYMTGGMVIVLGLTGRNFAAGMSGGIAYVYDLDGTFRSKANAETVELLLLSEKDKAAMKPLLQEFVDATGSQVAQKIVNSWPLECSKFVKVFPYEYQRALKALEDEKVAALAAQKASDAVDAVAANGNGAAAAENGHKCSGKANGNGTPTKAAANGTATSNGLADRFEQTPDDDPSVNDIEESVPDYEREQRRLERISRLDKTRGFIKYKREANLYRDPVERQQDWDEVYNHRRVQRTLKKQAARCMECGVPFCQSNVTGCPLGNIIPKWNDLVFHDEWKEALNQLLATNNFPEFTGRVCPAPCEGSCVLGISEPPVTIKNIECSIIDYAFQQKWIVARQIDDAQRSGKRVAIIGSGPSGLAAAAQLNTATHSVTVFERNERVGGLLQYGIPTMKLSKAVVQRRVDLMAEEGVVFRTGVNVGKDLSAAELLRDYDAVLLTTGATWPRDLPVANRDLNGIHFAMEFLEASQKALHGRGAKTTPITAAGKDVLVIGGGDTGCDCIATSLRQGAKSITSFEIMPVAPKQRAADNPWPQWPKVFRVDYGHEEVRMQFGRDPRMYCVTTKEFVGDAEGNVCGVNTVQVEWTKAANGAWSFAEVAGTEKYYPADLVLLAMGFLGPERTVPQELGLELDGRGNVKAVQGQYGSSVAKVFAAGDCRRGQSLVVWAISEGRQAARQIDSFLIGGPSTLPGPGGVIDSTRMP